MHLLVSCGHLFVLPISYCPKHGHQSNLYQLRFFVPLLAQCQEAPVVLHHIVGHRFSPTYLLCSVVPKNISSTRMLTPIWHQEREAEDSEASNQKSNDKDADGGAKAKGQLTSEDERKEGAVTFENYKRYAKAGGFCLCSCALLTYVATETTRAIAEFSVADWSSSSRTESEENEHIVKYCSFAGASLLLLLLRGVLMAHVTTHASSGIHAQLLSVVMHATVSFFDTTQTGHIMNRFSRDIDYIDLQVGLS